VAVAAYLDDVLLVDRCLGGEEEAARELFRKQRSRVHASLYRVLGSNRDMDDLLQDTFIQVFASLRGFRGEARLSTWIDRIAVRVAYRYLSRKAANGPVLELVDEDDAGSGGDPQRRMIARDGVRRFYAALDDLSAASRIAFTLHELDGRSIAEVAACTGASETATKLRIWRARRALHKMAAGDPLLSEFLGSGDDADEHEDDAERPGGARPGGARPGGARPGGARPGGDQ
jgi:RNA polymerase sigma-70 factor (ECF subfamily)